MPNRKDSKLVSSDDLKNSKSEGKHEMQVVELLHEMRKEINENSKNISTRLDRVERFLTEELEALKLQMSALKEENEQLKETCSNLQNENQSYCKQLHEIKNEVNEMQQYSRNRNIEIVGVPLTEKEDVFSIIEKVATVIDVNYDKKDISAAHRLPSRKGYHPNIIIQFVSRSTRQEWLSAGKKKNLNAKQLSPHLQTSNIYINEHLTPLNKALLGRARRLKKENIVDFVWCKEGKVFVRRQDGDKAHVVRKMEDLEVFEN